MNKHDYRSLDILDSLHTSYARRSDFYIPSKYHDMLSPYILNNNYNYYCNGFHDDYITLAFFDNSPGSFGAVYFIKLYNDYSFTANYVQLDQLQTENAVALRLDLPDYCSNIYYDGSYHTFSTIKFNNNNTDDFLNSSESINYLPYLLYFSLPIILFVLAIKTFRRGLFR